MAVQPEDQKTADIFDHPSAVEAKKAAEKAEVLHLAAEHKLIPIHAFMRDERKADKKTATAARQDKHREKLKSAGLVQAAIPKSMADEIKATEGGVDAWLAQRSVQTERVVEVEKVIEVPADLSSDQKRLIALGRSVEASTGWRRSIIKSLLK